MTVALVLLVALGLAAFASLAWTAVRAPRDGRRRLALPGLLMSSGAAVLIVGGRHFANHWPGTGGHAAAHLGLPAGVAAFAWASTLSISSYWAHPHTLRSFPAAEVAWMAISPMAMACLVLGAATMARRVELSPGLTRIHAVLSRGGAAAMVGVLAGACVWIIAGDPGPRSPSHAGLIDLAGLVAMAAALLAAPADSDPS